MKTTWEGALGTFCPACPETSLFYTLLLTMGNSPKLTHLNAPLLLFGSTAWSRDSSLFCPYFQLSSSLLVYIRTAFPLDILSHPHHHYLCNRPLLQLYCFLFFFNLRPASI